jgi:signal transduction histidine kinase
MSVVKQLYFEHGAMSIIQMGEELIGHPSTAVNEIVKNAYDADADKCWVYTQYDSDPSKTFMIIRDNGLGMDSETLFGNWLKPSISSKRDEDRGKRKSQIYGRRYLGSKGIGRLAAMALGRYLTVVSKKSTESEYNWIRIDREIFRVDALLNAISFPGGQTNDFIKLFQDSKILELNNLPPNGNLINIIDNDFEPTFKEGTYIILQELDDSILTLISEEFNQKDLEETSIFKALRDMITPLKLNTVIQAELLDKGIISKELKTDNGEGTFELFYGINFIQSQIRKSSNFFPVEPSSILEKYDYRVYGKVCDSSKLYKDKYLINGKFVCRRLDEDQFENDFLLTESFVLSDEYEVKRKIDPIETSKKYQNSEVGEFYFDIRIYDLDEDTKRRLGEILKTKGSRETTRAFSRFLGLKISKNGFGVKPYGEEELDWLGLGAKRVQKHEVSIGPNQLIGYTYLFSPQNDELSEKTNREGFFENRAFITFKKIMTGILEEAGRIRQRYRLRHSIGRKIKNKIDRPNTSEFINYIRNYSTDIAIIAKTEQFIEETNTAFDNLENSLTFSQRLASLGSGLELVYHELSQPISALGAAKTSIEINVKKINEEGLKNILLDRVSTLAPSIKLLEELKESLQPAIGKSLPSNFNPIVTFQKVCHLFRKDFEDLNISTRVMSAKGNFEIRDHEYLLWVSFLNIMNNAIYWLKFQEGAREIIFECPDKDLFIISNTSAKIPEDDLDLIFEYGITMRKEKNATGLGLAFTRNLLSSRDWDIYAENRNYGPAFIIKKNVKLNE